MGNESTPLGRRNRGLQILNEVASVLNGSVDLESALGGVLDRVGELLELQAGWIWLLHPDTGESYLAAFRNLPAGLTAQPECMDSQSCWCLEAYRRGTLTEAAKISVVACSRLAPLDDEAAGGLRFHASVPLLAGEERLGLMNVAGVADEALPEEDLRLLHTVGDMLSIAVQRTRLHADSLRAGATEERYRLAREIHDTLGQGLAGVLMRLESLDATLDDAPGAPPRARELTRETLELTRRNLEEARRAVLDLRSVDLEGRGLGEALHSLGESVDAGPEIDVQVSGLRPLPSRLEAGLYRAAQESVRNALEHGAPGRVVVRLVVTAETARLSVEDDGTGFDVAAETPERWGLVGLNERVRLLGGELSVQSEAGRGTRIEATIPLKEICGVG